MRRTVVIDLVALTGGLLDPTVMPRLAAWAASAGQATVGGVLPAVTCSVQATYLTGAHPDTHGIVANGWYSREDCEVRFWRQSNHLIQAPRLWELGRRRDPAFTCANLFWWFNMYGSVDYSVTPRPMYPADGRKLPDVYTTPANLRDQLQTSLGTFPLFEFWGPRTTIRASEWIAAASRHVEEKFAPTLSLVYLPHLDYNLQRVGPTRPAIDADLAAIDRVCGDLLAFYEARGVQSIVLSEYGIHPVSQPIHINRALREAGLVAVRTELGRELLDAGASAAFAVADHQVAHVYVRDADDVPRVRAVLERLEGVGEVLDATALRERHLAHPRCGDLVAVAAPNAWFTYYYWIDDARAPDFARTVDIHRKPGYDPVELFLDPARLRTAWRMARALARKGLGMRYLMDVIPLDASLVKGSHGRPADRPEDAPLLLTRRRDLMAGSALAPQAVAPLILRHVFD